MNKCWYILKEVNFRKYDFIPLNPTGRWKIVYNPNPDRFHYFYDNILGSPDLYIEHESKPGIYQWIEEYDIGEDYERFEYINDCNAVLPENKKTSPPPIRHFPPPSSGWFNTLMKRLFRNIS